MQKTPTKNRAKNIKITNKLELVPADTDFNPPDMGIKNAMQFCNIELPPRPGLNISVWVRSVLLLAAGRNDAHLAVDLLTVLPPISDSYQ